MSELAPGLLGLRGDPPTRRVTHLTDADGACMGLRVLLWCPGCHGLHAPRFACPEHGAPADGPTWDGDPNSEPFTMSPSLLTVAGPGTRCHSFVEGGRWRFLSDCDHALRGRTVDLAPLPEWLT